MRELYKNISTSPEIGEIADWVRQATRERGQDLEDYNSQVSNNPFVFPAPASSSDLIGTEKAGDIAADASYVYVVVNNAGTLEWRRAALSSF